MDALEFVPVRWPDDRDAAASFLAASRWPHHGRESLSIQDARSLELVGDGVETHWIRSGSENIGIVRIFDLQDIPEGSPLFDLRIAQEHRGRGVGGEAVKWLTGHLLDSYPTLRRIEATTRADNIAMQRALDRCGYRLEGRFVEAWTNEDGSRADALSFAILRREFRR